MPRLLQLGTLTGAYFLAGKLGLAFAVVHSSTSVIWPPTGIALAAFLVMGRSVWPAIALGAFLVNITTSGQLWSSVAIALGNTLEGVVGAALIRRYCGGVPAWDRTHDVVMFTVFGGLISPVVSASVGVTSLTVFGLAPVSDFGTLLLTWWLGDAVGAMTVAPLLLTWWRRPRWTFTPDVRHAELLLVVTLVAVSTVWVFMHERPLSFLLLPPLAWVAFRFSARAVATTLAIVALIATWGTVRAQGPFLVVGHGSSLFVLQAFIGTLSIMMLVIGAAIAERRRSVVEARNANRAKDRFLGMLGHELRNPLQAISTAVTLLEQVASTDTRRATQIVRRQTDHLTRLVNDLLDVTRIIEGKGHLVTEPVELGELTRRCLATLPTQQHRVHVVAQEAWVKGDVDRLVQIVSNLVSNALRYTPVDGRIDITVERRGDRCRLRVQDSGVGISPEFLDRIFEPFVQGDQALDRPQGGLGIGLSLVRGLVEAHGGSVRASSEGDGHGSTFDVWLPACASPEALGADAHAGNATKPGHTPVLRILVVEDNADARTALCDLLASVGHRVSEAQDGRTGLAMALEDGPDVALVDLGLPELDGFELARAVRSRGGRMHLIAVSGYGQPEDLRRAREAGFDAHLVKPVSLDEVLHALASLSNVPPPPSS